MTESSDDQMSLFDTNRFSSWEHQQWYEARRNNGIIVEKTISPIIDEEFNMTEAFASLGWESIVTLKGEYYPRLVREFYANMEDKESIGRCVIKTIVKGQDIVLTVGRLSQIMEIPKAGPYFEICRERVVRDPSYKFEHARQCLGIRRCHRGGKMLMLTKYLSMRQRLIVYMLGYNVMPKASSKNEVRMGDVYFLYKMLYGLGDIDGIPLASVIISQMRDMVRSKLSTRTMPFPLVLSRVFMYAGVDLSDEEVANTMESDILDESTLGRFGYFQNNGKWMKQDDDTDTGGDNPNRKTIEEGETSIQAFMRDARGSEVRQASTSRPSRSRGRSRSPMGTIKRLFHQLRQIRNICMTMDRKIDKCEETLRTQGRQMHEMQEVLNKFHGRQVRQ